MSTINRTDINEAIERFCEILANSGQTDAARVDDHLQALQDQAEEENLPRVEYMALIQNSMQELAGWAKRACLDLCGDFEEIDVTNEPKPENHIAGKREFCAAMSEADALIQCPWASCAIATNGGAIAFESVADYRFWMNEQ